jgi:branched-chain amino acid transport system substrate-binding protein
MDGQKIFMDCGAATDLLQFSVVTNYDKYKYWFKFTPYNVGFLVASLLKMTSTIGAVLKNALLSYGDGVAEDYRVPEDDKLRVAMLTEDALWCQEMVMSAQSNLPLLGFTVVGTWLASPAATDISTELVQIAAEKPHITLTAFQEPVAAVYSSQRVELEIPAMAIGLGDIGPQKEHCANTEGKCNGEVMVDAWAEGLENTANTTAFFNAFVTKTGEYPIFTAATYYAVYCLKEAIEAVSVAQAWDGIADVVDPDNIDALIQYLEAYSHTGTSVMIAYYPMPEVDLGDGVYALSEEQVRVLYPSLEICDQNDWKCASPTGAGPHIAHDIVYGPSYQTGIGSQWQDGHKVGVWPMDFGRDSDAAWTDRYGCWNFEYPGTVDVMIPIEGFLA